MRSTLALIAGGAAAGASMSILRLVGAGPTEQKVLAAIIGVIAWSTVQNGGGAKA